MDEALETARETLRKKDSEDSQTAKKRILDAFSEIGITPGELEKYLMHKTDTITPAEEKILSRTEALKEKLKSSKRGRKGRKDREEEAEAGRGKEAAQQGEKDVPDFSPPESGEKAGNRQEARGKDNNLESG